MTPVKNIDREDFNLIVRIVSTDLDGKKQASVGLCKIKGIGHVFSNAILHAAKINTNKLIGNFSNDDIKKIEQVIKTPAEYGLPSFLYNRAVDVESGEVKHVVGPELRLQKDFDIRRMRRIRSYKGFRHSWRLKVRGQRTKSTGRKGGPAVAKKKVVKK